MLYKIKSDVPDFPPGVLGESSIPAGAYLLSWFKGFGVQSHVLESQNGSTLITEMSPPHKVFCCFLILFILGWSILFRNTLLHGMVRDHLVELMLLLAFFFSIPAILVRLQHRLVRNKMRSTENKDT